jgi:hypothetical protein
LPRSRRQVLDFPAIFSIAAAWHAGCNETWARGSIDPRLQENDMANTPLSISSRRGPAMRAAAVLYLLCTGLIGWVGPAAAESVETAVGAKLPMAELERAFWACDHAATVGRIDSGTAITCGALTETFKQRRFNGDFNAMLAWWRENKEAEYLALDKASGRHALARLPDARR